MTTEHKHTFLKGAVTGLVIGLIMSDIVPTPADALYFTVERKLRDKWKEGTITPKQYWGRTAAAYYFFNPIWWGLVGGVSMAFHKDPKKQLGVLFSLLGAGAVVAIIFGNIKKDEKAIAQQQEELRILAEQAASNLKQAA